MPKLSSKEIAKKPWKYTLRKEKNTKFTIAIEKDRGVDQSM